MKKKLILFTLLALVFTGIFLTGCESTPVTGWVTTDEGTFYKDENGSCLSGWQNIDGALYYFGEDFAMVTGWLELKDGRYYLDENGHITTGWATVGGKTRRFGDDGRLLTGWQEVDGVRCYLDSDGTYADRWVEDGGLTYYMGDKGIPVTGWMDLGPHRYYFQENGCMLTGWAQFGGNKYYFSPNGVMQTGVTEVDGKFYVFDETGVMLTGWAEVGEYCYYLQEDGAAATGPTEIGDATYYFSPKGIHVYLVNPWNYLPTGYEVELSYIDHKQQIATSCYDALMKMLSDCAAAGHKTSVVSGYRAMWEQEFLFYRKINYYLDLDYSWEAARKEAATVIAVPGTSEHQLGLAVDIVDVSYPYLDDYQADTAAQKWLMEHCYDYGFILRYPTGTTEITGIIYEPWHYRYVGVEVAKDIQAQNVTLEEYLNAVVTE